MSYNDYIGSLNITFDMAISLFTNLELHSFQNLYFMYYNSIAYISETESFI